MFGGGDYFLKLDLVLCGFMFVMFFSGFGDISSFVVEWEEDWKDGEE